jgi:AcrR family transcriptional regulator
MAATDTSQQILDATFQVMIDIGINGLSLEEVARRARVSRQTLYRHFGNRDSLLRATIVREEARLLTLVADAAAVHTDLQAALTAVLSTIFEWTAAHPLLGKLLATEPEALLPLLASGDAPVISAARPAITAVLADRLPPGSDPGLAADVLIRLMLSYSIDPPEGDTDRLAQGLAALLVQGLSG